LALLGDIARIERIGVGLVLISRAVAEYDYVTTIAQCINPFGLRRCRLAAGRRRKCQENAQQGHSKNSNHHAVFSPFLRRGLSRLVRVRNFTGRGQRAFQRIDCGPFPKQRHKHQYDDAYIEAEAGDPCNGVFHANTSTPGRNWSEALQIACWPAATLKTVWIFL
jgi:hypothetical protein